MKQYTVDIGFELKRSIETFADSEEEAKDVALDRFRILFSEEWEIPPSASELDIEVTETV